jgi:hypothetical protein
LGASVYRPENLWALLHEGARGFFVVVVLALSDSVGE